MGLMDTNTRLRALPKTDEVLASPEIVRAASKLPYAVVIDAVRAALDDVRRRILAGEEVEPDLEAVSRDALARATIAMRPSLRRVINATGIIVHTNLGRSVLAEAAIKAVVDVASGYNTLEYDVEEGERGSRHAHVESLLCKLTGAEAAFAVNNNAAAVMMTIAAFARGKEAIVSRGQLVEIGGSFRVPDIMAESGARMIEVGTTNKTHVRDFENAITPDTGLLLKVHSSNFRVVGFTDEVSLAHMVELGAKHGIPVFEDQGSGVLFDLAAFGITGEPTVASSVAQGADVVSASGDKLFGGPQAGLVVGKADAIARLKKHPMARALRLDKMTLAALEATLRICLDESRALTEIPTLRMLTAPHADIARRARSFADRIVAALDEKVATVSVLDDTSRAGGGALPTVDIPTTVVALRPRTMTETALCDFLRLQTPIPIVSRIKDGRVLFDVRTLLSTEEEDAIIAALTLALPTE